ncbi:hypothetical protein D3C71_1475950 [compost metagenome]
MLAALNQTTHNFFAEKISGAAAAQQIGAVSPRLAGILSKANSIGQSASTYIMLFLAVITYLQVERQMAESNVETAYVRQQLDVQTHKDRYLEELHNEVLKSLENLKQGTRRDYAAGNTPAQEKSADKGTIEQPLPHSPEEADENGDKTRLPKVGPIPKSRPY